MNYGVEKVHLVFNYHSLVDNIFCIELNAFNTSIVQTFWSQM